MVHHLALQMFLLMANISVVVGSFIFVLACLMTMGIKRFLLPEPLRPPMFALGDKRRTIRAFSRTAIELGDGQGHFAAQTAKLVDISLEGLCFSSSLEIHSGDEIQARINSAEEGPLTIDGQVVWTRTQAHDHLYGLKIQKAVYEIPAAAAKS